MMKKISKESNIDFDIDIDELKDILIELKQINRNLEILNNILQSKL